MIRKRKRKNGKKIKIARKRETVTKNKQTKKSVARKYTMWALLPVVGGAAEWSLPSCSCEIEALALPVTNSLSWMKVTIFFFFFSFENRLFLLPLLLLDPLHTREKKSELVWMNNTKERKTQQGQLTYDLTGLWQHTQGLQRSEQMGSQSCEGKWTQTSIPKVEAVYTW